MKQFRVDIVRNRDGKLLWSEIVPAEWEMVADQKVSDEFFETDQFTDEAFHCNTTELFED